MTAEGRAHLRVRVCNEAPVRTADQSDYVLYWMIAARRTRWNGALDRAIAHARAQQQPLIVFEPLRCDYRWASDRLHAFVVQGMRDQARALARTRAAYYPFVERRRGHGQGLLARLAARASVVVTDDSPAFFLPRAIAAAASALRDLGVRLEAVDGNGLLPLAATDRLFSTAASFRRFLHKSLIAHLDAEAFPAEHPFAGAPPLPVAPVLPSSIVRRWPPATDLIDLDAADLRAALARLPIDHQVAPVALRGGQRAAARALTRFLDGRLAHYHEDRNEPDRDAGSGLSPYLHFGHLSPHEIFAAVMSRERWTTRKIQPSAAGRREGWWGASAAAEAFLDELITWREIGFNMSHLRPDDYERYESLPAWARATLQRHARDARPHHYPAAQLEAAATGDPLWNAAQRQLVREGRIHTYLRMLWGKKILEWSRTPQEAHDIMVHLNNKYALDGRDPSSYNGIGWVFGRYDRPWGPERPIFGTVRYMSSQNTARKLDVKAYLARHS